jgi:hypothetical protein
MSSAPPQGTELCEDLSNVISENIQSLVEQESILPALEEFGALSTAVLEKPIGCLKHLEEERERLITLCGQDLFGRALMIRVNSPSRCRHCHVEFNLRVDSTTVGWGLIRTRHWRSDQKETQFETFKASFYGKVYGGDNELIFKKGS